MKKVCLDPGHGGYDPGAIGNGLRESDITLEICLKLKPLLEKNGISVSLTRDGDYAPGHLENQLNEELNYRVTVSNNFAADLFVAVHINAGGGTGQEILVYGFGGNAETAANKLLPYLVEAGEWTNRGIRSQNILVLKETSAPAVLTENGFIDSTADAAKLKNSDFRQALAVAHAKGICDYFGIRYEEGEEKDMLDVAVVYYSPADYSMALIIANLNDGCAMFCRNGAASVNAAAMNAKKVYTIGGSKLGHSNEIYLSGKTALDTLIAVANNLQGK